MSLRLGDGFFTDVLRFGDTQRDQQYEPGNFSDDIGREIFD